jgi:dihydrofolate reductase
VARLRAHNISMSADGYMAGRDQGLENPLGIGGERLHEWLVATRMFQSMLGNAGEGATGVDNDFAEAGDVNIGATIMGRNMFGPIRGDWPDEEWRGWWGPEPPYHHPVFVLTNHAREPIPMEGGTTFYFVTDGIESALAQAVDAAGGQDVRIGGGASTLQQYLKAGLIDDLHVVVVPVLLRGGERLFDNLDGGPDGYECVEFTTSPAVAHLRFAPMS